MDSGIQSRALRFYILLKSFGKIRKDPAFKKLYLIENIIWLGLVEIQENRCPEGQKLPNSISDNKAQLPNPRCDLLMILLYDGAPGARARRSWR